MNVVEPIHKTFHKAGKQSRTSRLQGKHSEGGAPEEIGRTDPVADLFSPDRERREAAIPRLVEHGIASIPLLSTLVLRPLGFALGRWPEWQQMLPANAIMSRCDVARQAAMRALVRIGEPSLPQLIRMLQVSELQIQVLAAEALVQIHTPAAQDAIETLLREERHTLRGRLLRWLLHMQIAGSALLAILAGILIAWHPGMLWGVLLLYLGILPLWLRIPCPDGRWYLRHIAVQALARANDTRLIGTLAAGLADPNSQVRAETVTGLIRLLPKIQPSNRQHIAPAEMRLLVRALDGDDPALAVAILGALRQIGDERVLRRVAFLIDSPLHFAPVRMAAHHCLPYVKRRIQASQQAQSLLRPLTNDPTNEEYADSSETLLRSVEPEANIQCPDELLRPLGQVNSVK